MRVLVVTSGWPTDGQPERSIFVAHQVDALRASGIQVDVVHYVGQTDPRNYLRARREVKQLLARERHDLIHAHFGQSALVAFPARVPVVLTFHGSDLFGVVGRSGRYTIRGRMLSAVSRWGARKAHRVIVQSPTLAAELPDGVASVVIPVGVDLEIFRPGDRREARRRLGLPLDRRLVLFGGRPSQPVKRYELARSVVDRLQPPGADLLTVEGRPRRDVAELMAAADALLVTSRHESGPLIVKEALACDRPVVSVDVGDVRSVLDGLAGCAVASHDDPGTLADALEGVLRTSGAFRAPGLAARFSETLLTERVIELYADLLRREDRSRDG